MAALTDVSVNSEKLINSRNKLSQLVSNIITGHPLQQTSHANEAIPMPLWNQQNMPVFLRLEGHEKWTGPFELIFIDRSKLQKIPATFYKDTNAKWSGP